MYMHAATLLYPESLHTIPLFTAAQILHTEGIFCYKHNQTSTLLLSPALITGSASLPQAGSPRQPSCPELRFPAHRQHVWAADTELSACYGQPGILLYICSAWGFLRPRDLVCIFKNLSSHCFAIKLFWWWDMGSHNETRTWNTLFTRIQQHRHPLRLPTKAAWTNSNSHVLHWGPEGKVSATKVQRERWRDGIDNAVVWTGGLSSTCRKGCAQGDSPEPGGAGAQIWTQQVMAVKQRTGDKDTQVTVQPASSKGTGGFFGYREQHIPLNDLTVIIK